MNGRSESPPSPGGNEPPVRSRNARAQARHRAKRAAYVKDLEIKVQVYEDRLNHQQAQIDALIQRGGQAMQNSHLGSSPGPDPQMLRRIEDLEAQLARAKADNAVLQEQLARGGNVYPQRDSHERRRNDEFSPSYMPYQGSSGSATSDPSLSPPQAPQLHPGRSGSMASAPAHVPFYLLPLPPNALYNSLLIACARAPSPPLYTPSPTPESCVLPPMENQQVHSSDYHPSSAGTSAVTPGYGSDSRAQGTSPPLHLPSPHAMLGELGNPSIPLHSNRAPPAGYHQHQALQRGSRTTTQQLPYPPPTTSHIHLAYQPNHSLHTPTLVREIH